MASKFSPFFKEQLRLDSKPFPRVGQAQMASTLESFNEFMRNQETVSQDKEGGEEGSIHEVGHMIT